MIKHTKVGIDIDVKAYLKEVKCFYYVILVYKNDAGKRRDKSFPTKLPLRGNKTRARKMADGILRDFQIPDEDLYLLGELKQSLRERVKKKAEFSQKLKSKKESGSLEAMVAEELKKRKQNT